MFQDCSMWWHKLLLRFKEKDGMNTHWLVYLINFARKESTKVQLDIFLIHIIIFSTKYFTFKINLWNIPELECMWEQRKLEL